LTYSLKDIDQKRKLNVIIRKWMFSNSIYNGLEEGASIQNLGSDLGIFPSFKKQQW